MRELDMSNACLVSDPGIPTLEKALDPTVLRECVPEVLPSEWGDEGLRIRRLGVFYLSTDWSEWIVLMFT